MKRRLMFTGLTSRPPLHRISEIRAKIWAHARRFIMCLRVWNAWHFEFGQSQSELWVGTRVGVIRVRFNLTANIYPPGRSGSCFHPATRDFTSGADPIVVVCAPDVLQKPCPLEQRLF
jgi:hypothetical protein